MTTSVIPDQERFNGHRERFAANRPLRSKVFAKIGRLGGTERMMQQELTDNQAEVMGKRRITAVAAAVTLLFGARWGVQQLNAGEAFANKVEACASVLQGNTVDNASAPMDDHPLVVAENYSEVAACRAANGDAEQAARLLAEHPEQFAVAAAEASVAGK